MSLIQGISWPVHALIIVWGMGIVFWLIQTRRRLPKTFQIGILMVIIAGQLTAAQKIMNQMVILPDYQALITKIILTISLPGFILFFIGMYIKAKNDKNKEALLVLYTMTVFFFLLYILYTVTIKLEGVFEPDVLLFGYIFSALNLASFFIIYFWTGRSIARTLYWLASYNIAFGIIFTTNTNIKILGFLIDKDMYYWAVLIPWTILTFALQSVVFRE